MVLVVNGTDSAQPLRAAVKKGLAGLILGSCFAPLTPAPFRKLMIVLVLVTVTVTVAVALILRFIVILILIAILILILLVRLLAAW